MCRSVWGADVSDSPRAGTTGLRPMVPVTGEAELAAGGTTGSRFEMLWCLGDLCVQVPAAGEAGIPGQLPGEPGITDQLLEGSNCIPQ